MMVSVCLNVKEPLVQRVMELYRKISALDDLRPSDAVNDLFSELVRLCIPPHPIDVSHLCSPVQDMRHHLIQLCGRAESLLEFHYSATLAGMDPQLDHLHLFPYYSNYLNLARLECALLRRSCPGPRRLAFVGSGPLPLTSIVLARSHLRSTVFHNFDIDPAANNAAARLLAGDPDLSQRVAFVTQDILDVPAEVLCQFDVVFLAALVGMDVEEKLSVIEHLAANMAPGALLMLRSAHGARAFLYPVVEPRHLRGFEVLSVFHPTDDVINSVVVARRCQMPANLLGGEFGAGSVCSNKCAEVECFSSLVGEVAVDDHICEV